MTRIRTGGISAMTTTVPPMPPGRRRRAATSVRAMRTSQRNATAEPPARGSTSSATRGRVTRKTASATATATMWTTRTRTTPIITAAGATSASRPRGNAWSTTSNPPYADGSGSPTRISRSSRAAAPGRNTAAGIFDASAP